MESALSGAKNMLSVDPKYKADTYFGDDETFVKMKKLNNKHQGLFGVNRGKEYEEQFNEIMKKREKSSGNGGGQGRSWRRAIMVVLIIVLVALIVMIAMPSCINNHVSPFEELEDLFNCSKKVCECPAD